MKAIKLFVATAAMLLAGVLQAYAYLPVSVQITSNTSNSSSGDAYNITTTVSYSYDLYTSVTGGSATASVSAHDASLMRVNDSCTTPTYHKPGSGSFSAIGNCIAATCSVSASGTTSCWVYSGITFTW